MQNSASKDRQTIFRIKVDTYSARIALRYKLGSATIMENEKGFGMATELGALCEVRNV